VVDLLLTIDPAVAGGRRRAIEAALRSAIRAGRLVAGTALPSSRTLAADLGVARGTVVDAYDQLAIEGYLDTRQGGRTVVASLPLVPEAPEPPAPAPPPPIDLRAGAPDLSAFPVAAWTAATRSILRAGPADALDYAPARGRPELRAALAAYLARARGVVAAPEHVVVGSGIDNLLAVLTRALAAGGRRVVAMEDPCLHFHRAIVTAAGARVVPAPVDEAGVEVDAVAAAGAGAAVVTPARQSLLGMTLAPGRRSALLAWARASDGLVVEDDYDGELRYDRQPIGAVQGLDPERVLYLGTLSKSLAPGLRLAWAVVPPAVADDVDEELGVHSTVSSLDQLVVAELLGSQAFDRHLRRMRTEYRRRRDRFVALLGEQAPATWVEGVAAGLHALVRWPEEAAGEYDLLAEATDRGIGVTALGPGWHGVPRAEGLVVAYGRPPAHDLERRYQAFAALMADMVA
jgi:GntR family transcriptional regulator / MocR family aminotransferase